MGKRYAIHVAAEDEFDEVLVGGEELTYLYPCETCNGNGFTPCVNCKDGTCPLCGGKKVLNTRKPCPSCGDRSVECAQCDGTGECLTCKGTGKFDCPDCFSESPGYRLPTGFDSADCEAISYGLWLLLRPDCSLNVGEYMEL